jgi:hypothetical protein
VARVEDNLKVLENGLSSATYGDLTTSALAGWQALRRVLEAEARVGELPRLDALAEAMLAQANALVLALESSGLARQAGVVNIAGRQRMLSQRMAKLALLQSTAADREAVARDLDETAAAFEEGMSRLGAAPLSTPEIRVLLERGEAAWQTLRGAVARSSTAPGRIKLAAASEELLELFDKLTEAYENSMQVLMGG